MSTYKVKAWVRFERTVEVEAESREKAEDMVYTDLSKDRLRLDYDDMVDAGADVVEEGEDGYVVVVVSNSGTWFIDRGTKSDPQAFTCSLAASLSRVAELPGGLDGRLADGGYVVAFRAPVFWSYTWDMYCAADSFQPRIEDIECANTFGRFGRFPAGDSARWKDPVPLEWIQDFVREKMGVKDAKEVD